jgi:SAM-dependent methyltransferase/UDP-N-acetylglucosamine transferase subunit ALG13
MMDILVTVGMNPWPFDRLLRAVEPLCARHRVFAQSGTSTIRLPCAQAPFVPYPELMERIRGADVVITHAGNTVRLVQRAGKVPIVVARMSNAGEMANDHQVEYLRHEERTGRVIAVWNEAEVAATVEAHESIEPSLVAERPLPERADGDRVAAILDGLWAREGDNPFARHHLRRYAYAWSELCDRRGRHLDVGCGRGEFLAALAATTELDCVGVDPNGRELAHVRATQPRLRVSRVVPGDPLPFPDEHFDSVSLLDVLEHAPNEDALLAEIARVLVPGGFAVVTVPARHVLYALDPDNAKFRAPRLHRLVYSRRFGREVYGERFVDRSDHLCGDMSIGKREHTNYRREWLVERLTAHGLQPIRVSGVNLFWRWFQVPALLLPPRAARHLECLVCLDGKAFRHPNLFLSATKTT